MEELAAHELAIGPLQLKLVADVDAHVLGDDRDLLAVFRPHFAVVGLVAVAVLEVRTFRDLVENPGVRGVVDDRQEDRTLAVLRALLAGSHRDIDALAIDARLAAVGIGRCFGLSELGAARESRCSCQ